MAILGALCTGIVFLVSMYVAGKSGNPFNLLALNFSWIIILAVLVRLRNQLSDPVDNIYLKKEILIQVLMACTFVLFISYLAISHRVNQDIINILSLMTLSFCGFIFVDVFIFIKNRE